MVVCVWIPGPAHSASKTRVNALMGSPGMTEIRALIYPAAARRVTPSWPGLSLQVGFTRLATQLIAELGQARVLMPSRFTWRGPAFLNEMAGIKPAMTFECLAVSASGFRVLPFGQSRNDKN